jgi:hypothetical protein
MIFEEVGSVCMNNVILVLGFMLGGLLCGGSLLGVAGLLMMRERSQAARKSTTAPQNVEFPDIPAPVERPEVGFPGSTVKPPLDSYQTVDSVPPPDTNRPWMDGVGGVIAGQRINIWQDETVIGRSRVCDVQIQDPKISRQHAMLRLYKGNYFLQDMQSSRGTLVNDQRVQNHLLKDGDHIRVGDTVLVFHFNKPPL